jgi:DNA-binding protein
MEKYRKTSTRAVDCVELQVSGPHIKVSANGRVKDYVAVFEKFVAKQEKEIVVSGIGMAVNKTVSVAEMIKRNHKVSVVSSIFDVAEVDIWDSVDGDLDALQVTRHIPAMKFKITNI